jgi:hypothetical protein
MLQKKAIGFLPKNTIFKEAIVAKVLADIALMVMMLKQIP